MQIITVKFYLIALFIFIVFAEDLELDSWVFY